MREFARFLWKYGFVEPEWTLSVIEIILNNALFRTEQVQLSGGEELIRAILRVYTDPMVDNTLRGRAMDSFDRLMERFTRQAQIILWEWDRR